MVDLKDIQIQIYKLKDVVVRETEFSPRCHHCHDERFYLISRHVLVGLTEILRVIARSIGPLPEKPVGNN